MHLDKVSLSLLNWPKNRLKKITKGPKHGKMMTELDILAKNIMGANIRSVNVVDVGGLNPE